MGWHRKHYDPSEVTVTKMISFKGGDFEYARLPIQIQMEWDKRGEIDLDDVPSKTDKQRLWAQRRAMCEWLVNVWQSDPSSSLSADHALLLQGYLEWHAEHYGQSPMLPCADCLHLPPEELWKKGLDLCGIYHDTPLLAVEFKTESKRGEKEHVRFGRTAADFMS